MLLTGAIQSGKEAPSVTLDSAQHERDTANPVCSPSERCVMQRLLRSADCAPATSKPPKMAFAESVRLAVNSRENHASDSPHAWLVSSSQSTELREITQCQSIWLASCYSHRTVNRCRSCFATNALGLMQFGDVGAALVFRHLDECYLACHQSHLRLGGKIGGTARA